MQTPVDPEQFALFGDTLPEVLLLLDPKGVVLALNRAARRVFPGMVIGDDIRRCVRDDEAALTALFKTWRRASSPTPGMLHRIAELPDDHNVPMRCEGSAIAQGQAIVLRCRSREQASEPFAVLNEEIRKLQHANHDLRHDREYLARRVEERTQTIRENERRLHGILEALAEAVICFDRQGVVLNTNAAADRLFGYPQPALDGLAVGGLLPELAARGGDLDSLSGVSFETTGTHHSGTRFPVELKIRELILKDETVFTALVTDITERRAHLHKLRQLAELDSLTGLYNRRYLHESLDTLCGDAAASAAKSLSLLFIDLDNFKYVNDELGHSAGDAVLREVSALLGHHARASDLLARLGGDEFALLIQGAGKTEVDGIAERLRGSLEAYEYVGPEGRADVGCSIGVATYTPGLVADAWMAHAEFSCRQAKSQGRNRVWRHSASDALAAAANSKEVGWIRRIKDALRDDRFVVHAQPIKHAVSGALEAAEVLMRLRDTDGTLIMPNAFLPPAERFGLMPELDRWVIRHVLPMAAREACTFSINLSGTTLVSPSIADFIAEQIALNGTPPGRLVFEITETAAVANLKVAGRVLKQIQALGCRTALDDFGAGMSSFAYLRELPVDWVKIDGRFVKDIDVNDIDRAMLRAMVDIARTLGKQTVAEWVEHERVLSLLQTLDVDFVQGYHTGGPQTIEALLRTSADARKVA